MELWETQSWENVLSAVGQLAAMNEYFAPMRDAVEEIAASPFAIGLHPILSMQTLRLFQSERVGPTDEELRIDFESGEFVVRHRSGSTPDPRFALNPRRGVWTKRGSNAMKLLERALHHLRWFNEYGTKE